MRTNWVTQLVFSVKDRMSTYLNKASNWLTNLGSAAGDTADKFKSLAGAYTAWLVARRTFDIGKSLVRPALEMEKAEFRLRFLTRANTKEMEKFRDATAAAAERTEYGPKVALDTLSQLRRSLGGTEAAVRNLYPVLVLAQQSFGEMTPDVAARRFSNLARAFGMTAENARAAAEMMVGLGKEIGVPAGWILKVAGKLSQAEVLHGSTSFADVLKTIAVAMRGMPNPERAGTRLIRFATMLNRAKIREGLESIGVVVENKLTGKMRSFQDILVQMANVDAVMLRKKLTGLWDQRNLNIVVTLVKQLREAFRTSNGEVLRGQAVYDHLNKTLIGSGGVIKEFGEGYLGLASTSLTRIRENVYLLLAALGGPLLSTLKFVTGALLYLVKAAQAIAKVPVVGWLIKTALTFGMLVGAVKLVSISLRALRGILTAVRVYMKKTAVDAMVAAPRIGILARAFDGLKVSLFGAGRAAKYFGTALKYGSLGLLAVLPDVIMWIMGKLKKREGEVEDAETRMMRKRIEAMVKQKDLTEVAGRKFQEYIHVGTEEMNNILDRLAGIGKYRSPVVDMNAVARAQKFLQNVTPATLQQKQAIAGGKIDIEEFASIMKVTAGKGKMATPRQARDMMGYMATLHHRLDKLTREMVSQGRMAPAQREKLLGGLEKKVLTPMHKGLKEGADWTRMAIAGSAGMLPAAPGQATSVVPYYQQRWGRYGPMSAQGKKGLPKDLRGLSMRQRYAMIHRSVAQGGVMGTPTSAGLQAAIDSATQAEEAKRHEERMKVQGSMKAHMKAVDDGIKVLVEETKKLRHERVMAEHRESGYGMQSYYHDEHDYGPFTPSDK